MTMSDWFAEMLDVLVGPSDVPARIALSAAWLTVFIGLAVLVTFTLIRLFDLMRNPNGLTLKM